MRLVRPSFGFQCRCNCLPHFCCKRIKSWGTKSPFRSRNCCKLASFTLHYWRQSRIIVPMGSFWIIQDINKCKTVAQRKIHSQEVNYIGHYVDFSENNLYFSVSKNEKRIVFSDLRTNKKVHITNGLPMGIRNAVANKSGKIFVNNKDSIYLVDICSNFDIVKVFKSKGIKKQVILGRYYITGC